MLRATWEQLHSFLFFVAVAKAPIRSDKESTIYERTFGFSGLVPGFLNKGPCRTRYWTVGCPLAARQHGQEVSSDQVIVKLSSIYTSDHRMLQERMFWTKTRASSIARSLGWEFTDSPSLDCLHRFAMFHCFGTSGWLQCAGTCTPRSIWCCGVAAKNEDIKRHPASVNNAIRI